MLTRPNLTDTEITHCLQMNYSLKVKTIRFLALGADVDTAVFYIETESGKAYYVKLRKGNFTSCSVAVPMMLSQAGMKEVIPSVSRQDGRLWSELEAYKVILYPFIQGWNACEKRLTRQQWIELGSALKNLHSTNLPPQIAADIPREDFSPLWRNQVLEFLNLIEHQVFPEQYAAELADFLKSKREETLHLVDRTEKLSRTLQKQPLEQVLCHGDIHGWNLLIDQTDRLFIVDWDTLIHAPKERDLMFIGGEVWPSGYSANQEESLFYEGYGNISLNTDALSYYRMERIIEDIAAYCQQLFLSDAGGEDRKQAVENVKSNFLPGKIPQECD